ncbi:hypothetical protein DAPPUDRAFT_235035 [Daphnia pulex]|uniref:Uncharacterized protein n=1 Tax=Daphnia pulex TaxID=6669 RepID=E9FZ64_DAPPU|nr:hypothetical protein DAPPUDRAFT_235035 [Daphnia pulex]|eukprot:EFX87848.1 hypothetical protein DAPPUDRAFT_235035 [Daphnia pulex]
MKIIKEFIGVLLSRRPSGVLLSGTGVLLSGDHGQLELFTLLLFGVQWFCSPFAVERCSEMEFKTVRSCVVCVDRLHHARDNQDQQRLDQEEEKNGEAKNDDTHSNPQQRKPAEGKAHPPPATTTCKRKGTPIPRNFNLQKERAVRLSFTFEGHGDHYMKRVMQLGVEVG